MKVFKSLEFKKALHNEKMQVFEKMKSEQDYAKWEKLKSQYETYDKMAKPRGRVSADCLFSTAGTLLSIVLVLRYEKLDIITTKCWNWIRPKN